MTWGQYFPDSQARQRHHKKRILYAKNAIESIKQTKLTIRTNRVQQGHKIQGQYEKSIIEIIKNLLYFYNGFKYLKKKYCQSFRKEETVPNSFYEAINSLIPKSKTSQENYKSISSLKSDTKTLNY